MTVWITQREAGEILGLHKSWVARLVAKGTLTSRGTRSASLSRSQVVALAAWRADAPARDREASERPAAEGAATSAWGKPPDTDHDWLPIIEVARRLGITRVAVNKRCNRGRMPFVEHGGKRWVRLDLLEQVERARTARANRSVEPVPRLGLPVPGVSADVRPES